MSLFSNIRDCANLLSEVSEIGLNAGDLAFQPGLSLTALNQRAFDLVALGADRRQFLRQAGKHIFAFGKFFACRFQLGIGFSLSLFAPLSLRGQLFLFAGEVRNDVAVFGNHLFFALNIRFQLRGAGGYFVLAPLNPFGFFVELVAGNHYPLQGGGGLDFPVAQFRQFGGDDGLGLGSFRLHQLGLTNGHGGVGQGAFGLGEAVLGSSPAQMQDRRFGLADVAGDISVAVGLARLSLQAVQLCFQLGDDIIQTLKVVFGRPQAQFSLMTA